jgi:hypothetical protein
MAPVKAPQSDRETTDVEWPLPFPSPVRSEPAASSDMEMRHRSRLPTSVLASAVSTATIVAGICSAVWLTGQVNPNAANQSLAVADVEPVKPPKLLFLAPTAQGRGQATALGVAVHDLGDGGLAVVRGLANGTTLSLGKRLNDGDWWLSALELSAAKIEPPSNFIGAMDVTIELRLPNTELVDRHTLHFTWQEPAVVAETSDTKGEAHVRTEVAPSSPVVWPFAAGTSGSNGEVRASIEVGPSSPVVSPSAAGKSVSNGEARASTEVGLASRSSAARHLSPEDVAASLKRGEDLVSNGDLGAARLVFQRLADDGNANAALALAKIYDPMMPEKHRAHGFESDAALAQYWYERAKALGSNDARRKLQVARHSGDAGGTGYETSLLNGH